MASVSDQRTYLAGEGDVAHHTCRHPGHEDDIYASQVCTLASVNDAIATCDQHIWLQGKHASLADGIPVTDLAASVSNT